MTTNNAVNSPLSGSTGSGRFLGSNSPTLITPNLGIATATSFAFSPTTSGMLGSTAGDLAANGYVGEYHINSGAGVSLSSGVLNQIASQSITAGDWDVYGYWATNPAGTTVTQSVEASISTSNSAHGTSPTISTAYTAGLLGAGHIPYIRVNVSGTTTYYLNITANFTVSTMTATCVIIAFRRR